MSKHGKCSMSSLVLALLGGVTLLGVQADALGQVKSGRASLGRVGNRSPGPKPFPTPSEQYAKVFLGPLLIKPIKGLTTTRLVAPAETSVPLGAVVRFVQMVDPKATLTWTGAEETQTLLRLRRRRCPFGRSRILIS